MRPPDVLQPILASVGNDPEHPGIESPTHLGEMLVRLDEAELEDVLRDVWTARHAERVTVERIAVAGNQRLEGVAISGEHALNDELIGVIRINRGRLTSLHGLLSRLHDNRVTPFPRFGQGSSLCGMLDDVRHVGKTRDVEGSNNNG